MKKVVLLLNLFLLYCTSYSFAGYKGDVNTSNNSLILPSYYYVLDDLGETRYSDNDGGLYVKTSTGNTLLNTDIVKLSGAIKSKQVTFIRPNEFYTITPYYNILYNDNDSNGKHDLDIVKIYTEKDNESFNYGTLKFYKKTSGGTRTIFDYINMGTGKRFNSLPDNDSTIFIDGNLEIELDNDDNNRIKKLDIYILYKVKG